MKAKSPVLYLAELRAQGNLRPLQHNLMVYQCFSIKSTDSIITGAIYAEKTFLTIIIIASIASAVAVAASLMLPFAKVALEKSENLYVIYCGHLVDENGAMTKEASRIQAADPKLVIVPHSFPDGELNLTPRVHSQFKDAGIKVEACSSGPRLLSGRRAGDADL